MQMEAPDNSLNTLEVNYSMIEECACYAASARKLFLQLTSEEQLMVLDYLAYLKETSCIP